MAAAAGSSGPPSVGLEDLDGVGAPPAFGGEGHIGTTSGSTLFGLIPDDALDAPVTRPHGASFDDTFGELDLPMPGDDLELDLLSGTPVGPTPQSSRVTPAVATPAARSAPAPMPPPRSGPSRDTIDAPAPRMPSAAPPPAPARKPAGAPPAPPVAARRPDVPTPFDLPAPVDRAATPAFRPPSDLPAPVERGTSSTFKVPSVDLPAPSRPVPTAFRAPEPPPFRGPPSPPGGTRPSDGAPRFGTDNNMISIAELDFPSSSDADLPAPAGVTDLPRPAGLIDLPKPSEANLPQSAEGGLLRPAEGGMLTSAEGGLLTPAALDVEPAHILPTAAEQALVPAGELPAPKQGGSAAAKAAGAKAAADVAAVGVDPMGARRSPAPRAVSGEGGRRPLILAAVGVGLIGLLAGGAWAAGVFDPPSDEVPVTRGGAGSKPKPKPNAPVAPAGKAVERAPEVLGQLALDTPAGYAAAIDAAAATGDPVGQAEAALLLHLRFGPDPLRSGQASGWLEPYAKQGEPFVQRVLGLAALAAGALPQAESACADDGPRTRVCRAMIRIAQRRFTDAVTEADAVLATTPSEVIATVLRHEAQAAIDASAELPKIEASLAKLPHHPDLLVVGIHAAVDAGALRKAHAWLAELGPADPSSKSASALRLRLRAELAQAAGATAQAARLYEEVAGLVPDDTASSIARVRSLIAANRVLEAETALRPLLQSRPDDAAVAILAATAKLEAGKGDDALAAVQAIEAKWPGRGDTALVLGQVQAMRLQSEAAQTSFASALQRDPTLVQASIEEARLLATLDRLGDGLAKLDTARKHASDRGDQAAVAQVLRAKAALLDKGGQQTAALAAYDQALEARPNDNAAQLARGLLRLQLGQHDAGRSDLLAVYERTGSFVGLTAPLGRIFVREGTYDQLEALVGDSLDDPDAPTEMLIVGARLRLSQGKTDDAKALLQRVLAVSPNDWETHLLMAQALLDAQEKEEALAEIDRSMPATPSAERHLLRGKILEHLGRYPEARPDYLKALQIDPDLDEARFLYGRQLSRAGESRAAVEELGTVTSHTDRFPAAYVDLGRSWRELGEGGKAIAALDRALELDATLYEAYYLRGRAYFDSNEIAKAAASFESACAEAASHEYWYPEALVFLGRAQARSGKTKAAREAFEKFLAVAPANHASRAEAERQLADLR